jgi:ribose transport system permease protein
MRLNGGEGDILAPVLGALLVTVLANGMNLLQIDGFLQEVCLGVLILATLAAGRLRGRL